MSYDRSDDAISFPGKFPVRQGCSQLLQRRRSTPGAAATRSGGSLDDADEELDDDLDNVMGDEDMDDDEIIARPFQQQGQQQVGSVPVNVILIVSLLSLHCISLHFTACVSII